MIPEEKIFDFLKDHQPVPPPPKFGEAQKILTAIKETAVRQTVLQGIRHYGEEFIDYFLPALATAAAAFVLATHINYQAPWDTVPSDPSLGAYLDTTWGVIYEEGMEGDEWSEFGLMQR